MDAQMMTRKTNTFTITVQPSQRAETRIIDGHEYTRMVPTFEAEYAEGGIFGQKVVAYSDLDGDMALRMLLDELDVQPR
jgi:hypothetical protein